MRPVYPGFLQLSGFMSMNLDRHLIAHKEFFMHLVNRQAAVSTDDIDRWIDDAVHAP